MNPSPVDPVRVRAERRRVVRHWQRYTPDQRATLAAAGKPGRVGEYFYTHPDLPRKACRRRGQAAYAAVREAMTKETP